MKLSASLTGRTISDETKKKLSEATKKYWDRKYLIKHKTQ
jgi:hypothetical protein